MRYCTPGNSCCSCQLFFSQSYSSPYQRPPHSPILISSTNRQGKPGSIIYTAQQKAVSVTNCLRNSRSTMFLRSVARRFSVQRGSLLLGRMPVRCASGVHQTVVVENGDMSVGIVYVARILLVERNFSCQTSLSLSHKLLCYKTVRII